MTANLDLTEALCEALDFATRGRVEALRRLWREHPVECERVLRECKVPFPGEVRQLATGCED